MSVRLFVALDLPAHERNTLSRLAGGIPGAKWVPPENLHLTLAFIGEVDEARLGEIDLALAAIELPAFDLMLGGVGVFGERQPRVLWAGVEPQPALTHLAAKIERALAMAGVPFERRKFAPHVTLARLRGAPGPRLGGFVQANALFRGLPFTVGDFCLFESHLGGEHAVYTVLERYPLLTAGSS